MVASAGGGMRNRVLFSSVGLWAMVALLLVAPVTSQAAGTTALEFLKLGVGARSAGMGEAFVSLADDASASYWNPAGLSSAGGQEVLFNHTEWFEDIRMENLSYMWSGEGQGLGLAATLLHVGGIEERDVTGELLGEFRFFDYALSASYARQMTPIVRLGVTGKVLIEQIDRTRATTAAADAGLLVSVPGTALQVGAALSNLGPGLKFDEQSDDLPLTFAVGASYQMPGLVPWMGGMTFAADVRKARDADTSLRLGWEVGVAGMAYYRLGYGTNLDNRDIATGVGINFGAYRLDYAFVPSDYNLGDTHRFSLALGF